MENSRLKMVQDFTGKFFTGNPPPFAHWLNGKVKSATKNSVEFQFTVTKEMANPVVMLQRGVISGMIDGCTDVTFFILKGWNNFIPPSIYM